MENEVRNMQQELQAVQQERKHLEHHRRMLCPPPPPPPCQPPQQPQVHNLAKKITKITPPISKPYVSVALPCSLQSKYANGKQIILANYVYCKGTFLGYFFRSGSERIARTIYEITR